jgi:hypothetical protein
VILLHFKEEGLHRSGTKQQNMRNRTAQETGEMEEEIEKLMRVSIENDQNRIETFGTDLPERGGKNHAPLRLLTPFWRARSRHLAYNFEGNPRRRSLHGLLDAEKVAIGPALGNLQSRHRVHVPLLQQQRKRSEQENTPTEGGNSAVINPR